MARIDLIGFVFVAAQVVEVLVDLVHLANHGPNLTEEGGQLGGAFHVKRVAAFNGIRDSAI